MMQVSGRERAILEAMRSDRAVQHVLNDRLEMSAARREWLLEQHPFRKAGVTVVKLEKETHRSRRLQPGEYEALMTYANAHLQALIVAALSTGAPFGELLSLQWSQVERDREGRPVRLRLVVDKTKTSRTRILPVPSPLGAVLAMRETAPDGQPHADDAYVFGNEVGERVLRVQTAWENCCRAAGIEGLHFHDLRRKFGWGCWTPVCRSQRSRSTSDTRR